MNKRRQYLKKKILRCEKIIIESIDDVVWDTKSFYFNFLFFSFIIYLENR